MTSILEGLPQALNIHFSDTLEKFVRCSCDRIGSDTLLHALYFWGKKSLGLYK